MSPSHWWGLVKTSMFKVQFLLNKTKLKKNYDRCIEIPSICNNCFNKVFKINTRTFLKFWSTSTIGLSIKPKNHFKPPWNITKAYRLNMISYPILSPLLWLRSLLLKYKRKVKKKSKKIQKLIRILKWS